MTAIPLQGLRLLLVRPATADTQWAEHFGSLGAELRQIPAMKLAELALSADARAAVSHMDIAVFVSGNAVAHFARHCASQQLDVPLHSQFLAVGKRTAELAKAEGFQAEHHGAVDSESLLAQDILAPAVVTGRRIVIIRGRGGRETLAKALRDRGAEVNYCELYERQCAQENATAMASCLGQWSPHLIPIASVDTLSFLLEMGRSQGCSDALLASDFLAPSARIKDALREHGIKGIVPAHSMNIADVSYAIQQWWALARTKSGELKS